MQLVIGRVSGTLREANPALLACISPKLATDRKPGVSAALAD